MNTNFYQNLPIQKNFKFILDENNYTDLPSDWLGVVADIKSSTQAIKRGDYKNVNLIGVAVIVVAQGVLQNLEFPYIFGGDGATLMVPMEYKDHLQKEYMNLKKMALSSFGLELRVGFVPLSELKKEGIRVKVAKYKLAGKKSFANFIGEGIIAIEKMVKEDNLKYEIPTGSSEQVNLARLTCLWKPIQAQSGMILSIIIKNNHPEKNYFLQIYSDFETIFQNRLDKANPVNTQSLELNSIKDNFKKELQMNKRILSFTTIKKIIAVYLMPVVNFIRKITPFFRRYINSFPQHSDFRKIDGLLKLTLDCTKEQAESIQRVLKRYNEDGKISYGLQVSQEVYITCFVKKMKEGEHIHFIDGSDGGYAAAAMNLKSQL